eukprot:1432609-Rhodomonas_salina.3
MRCLVLTASRRLSSSSIAVLLQTHPEEFVIRVDPDQVSPPSTRVCRRTPMHRLPSRCVPTRISIRVQLLTHECAARRRSPHVVSSARPGAARYASPPRNPACKAINAHRLRGPPSRPYGGPRRALAAAGPPERAAGPISALASLVVRPRVSYASGVLRYSVLLPSWPANCGGWCQAAKDAAEQRKQFSHISPEVQVKSALGLGACSSSRGADAACGATRVRFLRWATFQRRWASCCLATSWLCLVRL